MGQGKCSVDGHAVFDGQSSFQRLATRNPMEAGIKPCHCNAVMAAVIRIASRAEV